MKAEKQLLCVRVSHCNFTIKKLGEALDTHKQKLASILDTKDLAEVTRLLASAHQHTTEVTKCKQCEKFDRLCDKYNKVNKDEVIGNNINTDRCVINLSDRTIDNKERSVLRKGLNYAVTPPNCLSLT